MSLPRGDVVQKFIKSLAGMTFFEKIPFESVSAILCDIYLGLRCIPRKSKYLIITYIIRNPTSVVFY